ncbi:serine/threonine-protein kinase [soil metagenome]
MNTVLRHALAGRYEIQHELGRGGMATVYLARDVKHDRQVALKVLHPDLSTALGAERFTREIRTAARLQHPNILGVFDSGESDGQLWFTMPYADGESLRDRLTREPQLPIEDAIRIATEAARGLAHAHAHGVVHRDIKPENLLLARDGSTLVADFGIARSSTTDASITGTGMSLGTPAYMSPEQASGEREIDARADIYALAAVLYEMLAGEPPFTGPNAQAIIARLLTQDPRPIHPIRPAVPRALDAVIARAMSRVPVDRYAAMDAFMASMRAAVAAPTSSWSGGRTVLIAAVAVAVVAAGAMLVARTRRGTTDRAHVAEANGTSVAVLPFENRGRAEDAHIVDGIADEIRGKLAAVSGLTVIARASSNEYRGTSKRPQEIAAELGVKYLLSGTVQFEPASAGHPARLRVSPELVQVGGTATPATRWQQPFDADLAGIFSVQSDIATRVAGALDVALNAGQQGRLAERPTQNIQAYKAYLKGEQISEGMSLNEVDVLQRALVEYERAVTLDPTFVAAWARISRAHRLIFYWATSSVEDDTLSRIAADRAIALDSTRWESHWARSLYLASVAHTPEPAIAEAMVAERLAPGSAEVLTALSNAQSFAGQWEHSASSAIAATTLDPRSIDALRREAFARMGNRDYAGAEAAIRRALAISPSDPNAHYRLFCVRLAQGDRAGALAALRIEGDPRRQGMAFSTGASYLATSMDEPLARAALTFTLDAFGGNRITLAAVRSRAYLSLGDTVNARAEAESMLAIIGGGERIQANNTRAMRSFLFSLAVLGRKAEAIAATERALAALPVERDWIDGAALAFVGAQVYAMLREKERALALLERILGRRTFVQPGWVRVDETFASLRGDPRFERLTRIP